MNEMFFYDLRPLQKYDYLSGQLTDLKTLISHINELEIHNNTNLYLNDNDVNVPIICSSKLANWNKTIRTILILISGKTISDNSLSTYKEIYRQVERKYQNMIVFDLKFATFFTTLIVGFRAHSLGWSENGSNKVDDFMCFIDSAINNDNVYISSVFCAHRESDLVNKNTLVKEIKTASVRRYIYLLSSIFLNLPVKNVNVNLYHPTGGINALNEVFPNIALKHIQENKVGKLLDQMDKHFEVVKNTIDGIPKNKIVVNLNPLDLFVKQVVYECDNVVDGKWRVMDNFNSIKNHEIREITQEMTLKDISRYMPELNRQVDIGRFAPTTSKEKRAVDWYLGEGKLNLHSKSLYETMFYYSWGKLTRQNNGIAIGIDRDHDLFQVQSFALGYNEARDLSQGSPLLYSRRSETELGVTDVNFTSIRQFWRISENDKK